MLKPCVFLNLCGKLGEKGVNIGQLNVFECSEVWKTDLQSVLCHRYRPSADLYVFTGCIIFIFFHFAVLFMSNAQTQ